MLELIKKLIAFRYACKIAHWKSVNYSQHLLYDRLKEGVDGMVDDLAEKYFMANRQTLFLDGQILNSTYANEEVETLITEVLQNIDELMKGNQSNGIQNVLTGIADEFLTKKALVALK